MFILYFWLALAFFAGSAAARKARSGNAWFLLGLLTGPLAWLLVAILPGRARD